MRIGVPKEIKPQENRIGLTPASVKTLVSEGHEILVENNIEIPLSIYQKIYKTTSEIYIEDGFVYINTDGVPDHKSPYFLDTEWENEMYEPYDGTNPFVTSFNLNPNRISTGNIRFKIPVSPKKAQIITL